MLAIRLKRTGRRGHAQFRVVVQDSRLSPSSGRVVAYIGSYDPHTKVATLDKEKATSFLANGAHPSDRAAKLFKKEGVELPKWVKIDSDKERTTKNPAKLRRNQPKGETPAKSKEEPAEEVEAKEDETEVKEPTVAEETPEVVEEPAEEPEAPAEETPEAPEALDPEAQPKTEEPAA